MPKKKIDTVPVSDDLRMILICAVRYSLGRRTYMPGLVTEWIMENMKGKLPRGTIEVLRRDIREQREMGERGGYEALGDDCDVRTWTDFETWLIMEENGHEEK